MSQFTERRGRCGLAGLSLLVLGWAPAAWAQASFTNAAAIGITDCPNPCPASGQAASLYPSPVTVSGEAGVVQRVSVTLHGFSHAFTTTSAPIAHNLQFPVALIDPMQPSSAAPNRVRDLTPVTNGSYGTMKIRRRFTNDTGLPVIALRYRVVRITTATGYAVPAGQADLRVLDSTAQSITLTGTSTVTAQALTLQAPPSQAAGGGHNSSLAEGVITTTAPLANGASTVVEFNLGVQTTGNFRFFVNIEGLTVPPQ
jgi:hypothetical protein